MLKNVVLKVLNRQLARVRLPGSWLDPALETNPGRNGATKQGHRLLFISTHADALSKPVSSSVQQGRLSSRSQFPNGTLLASIRNLNLACLE